MNGYKRVLIAALTLSIANAQASGNEMLKAKRLYERMTGVKVSSTKPELKKVVEYLAKGDEQGAAKYITTTKDFLNVQIRNLSLRLSNKDESVKVPFNDFSALIVGVVRDNADFRDVLTAPYSYEISNKDERTRFFNQSSYIAAEAAYLNLADKNILVKNPKQKLVKNALSTAAKQEDVRESIVSMGVHPEPAGVLTSRTFAEANLSGGTNRRAVEFSLKQFMCVSMAEAADASASDQYVGGDVERFPGGDHNKYLTSCKSCHSVMDGMRGAFAKMDYVNMTDVAFAGIYTQMHGDFYRSENLRAVRDKYANEIIRPVSRILVPELEMKQEQSTIFKARVNAILKSGKTQKEAYDQAMKFLNTIRDPAIPAQLITEFRSIKRNVLSDIIANQGKPEYRDRLHPACVNLLTSRDYRHFSSYAEVKTANEITAPIREESLLLCNLDRRGDQSLVYSYYNEKMVAARVKQDERERLLAKLINKGRTNLAGLVGMYLRDINALRLNPADPFEETGVTAKMNRGSYAYGFKVTSDKFVNNATLGSKSAFFGWRGPAASGGNGVSDFGRMIADSRRFSQCMAKRVYESICSNKLDATQYATLVRLGDRFESLKYNLKALYADVALDPKCGIVKGE